VKYSKVKGACSAYIWFLNDFRKKWKEAGTTFKDMKGMVKQAAD
jgi:hypothetical protein